MRVNSINFVNLNCKNSSNVSASNTNKICLQKGHSDNHYNSSLNYLSPVNVFSPISFEGSGFRFVAIQNLPCPCCGRLMIPREVFDAQLTEKVLSGNGSKAVRILNRFRNSMHRIEKNCFNRMRRLSAVHPDKTLQELLVMLRPKSLKRLALSQVAVMDQIDVLGEGLSVQSRENLSGITRKARNIIHLDREDPYARRALETGSIETLFRRKNFIRDVLNWFDTLPDRDIEVGAKIAEKARALSSAKDNPDAFIVKYSGPITRNIEGQEEIMHRSSFEIGQRFLRRSLSTFEHVKPKSQGGERTQKNGLAECFDCNNARRNTPFSEWVDQHPEMRINARRHIERIMRLMADDKSIRRYHAGYPHEIAETLYEESGGSIGLRKLVEAKRIYKSKGSSTVSLGMEPVLA